MPHSPQILEQSIGLIPTTQLMFHKILLISKNKIVIYQKYDSVNMMIYRKYGKMKEIKGIIYIYYLFIFCIETNIVS